MVTVGPAVSTLKSRETVSVPCSIVNVWSPSESVELVNGEVQLLSTSAPSIRQLTLAPDGKEKVKLGVGSLVGDPEVGPEVITRPILQVLVAEPTFPASSVALTWKLCCPLASWLAEYGEEQGANPLESSWQLRLASESSESKPNEGFRLDEVEPSTGPELIVTAGATVSTVKDRDRIRLSFPGASIALTEKVWGPSGSGEPRVNGEAHGPKAWASKRHWKVEPASFEVNLKVGVGSLVGPLGPDVMLAWGGVVSAVKPLKVV
jgi:hypothetical protein